MEANGYRLPVRQSNDGYEVPVQQGNRNGVPALQNDGYEVPVQQGGLCNVPAPPPPIQWRSIYGADDAVFNPPVLLPRRPSHGSSSSSSEQDEVIYSQPSDNFSTPQYLSLQQEGACYNIPNAAAPPLPRRRLCGTSEQHEEIYSQPFDHLPRHTRNPQQGASFNVSNAPAPPLPRRPSHGSSSSSAPYLELDEVIYSEPCDNFSKPLYMSPQQQGACYNVPNAPAVLLPRRPSHGSSSSSAADLKQNEMIYSQPCDNIPKSQYMSPQQQGARCNLPTAPAQPLPQPHQVDWSKVPNAPAPPLPIRQLYRTSEQDDEIYSQPFDHWPKHTTNPQQGASCNVSNAPAPPLPRRRLYGTSLNTEDICLSNRPQHIRSTQQHRRHDAPTVPPPPIPTQPVCGASPNSTDQDEEAYREPYDHLPQHLKPPQFRGGMYSRENPRFEEEPAPLMSTFQRPDSTYLELKDL